MQRKVEEYLSSVKEQLNDSRAEILKKAGIVEREYGTDKVDDIHTEYDSSKELYYCERVLPVTDEEYDAIEKAYFRLQEANNESGSNGVASMLKVIAILTYIGGFIVGFILGKDYYGEFSFASALIYWVAFWVSGSMVLGFSEIINLLQAIKSKK